MVRCSEEGERTCPLEEDQRSPVDEQRGRDVRAPGGLLLFHPFLSATRLGGAPCKSCPALSKLSPPHPHPSRFSMSAKRFSWFSMPPSLPHSSRPFCSLLSCLFFPLQPLSPENIFQSLENARKIFPIIGKSAPFFPTIGKLFSNHWKTRLPPAGQRIARPFLRGQGRVQNGRARRGNLRSNCLSWV